MDLNLNIKTAIAENQNIYIKECSRPKLSEYGGKGAIVKVLGCGLCGSDIVKFLHNNE